MPRHGKKAPVYRPPTDVEIISALRCWAGCEPGKEKDQKKCAAKCPFWQETGCDVDEVMLMAAAAIERGREPMAVKWIDLPAKKVRAAKC